MLFNSTRFALFLPVVFTLYWLIANRNLKLQNILLLGSSYFFYACWDWRFLFLLIFSTLLDYYTGLKMASRSNQKVRKIWLWLSISINLGFLGIFKYYNFFASGFANLISLGGLKVTPWTLKIILPVGISFYTFHGLSYVVDIYKSRIKPEKNFIDYALFVSLFPLLVAGPIERATHLLPQIKTKRSFNYLKAVDGLKQILWGLFKKVVIADQCAIYANEVFNNPQAYNGAGHILGALFFTFQIYGDFSGYSDIALGTARLFGIELLRNFAFPYFSRDIAEFWRRWHISLSTWFRDYLYIPLGGSRGSKWSRVRNTFIIFLVSGFWHGANWTFIAWGFLHALFIMPSILANTNRNNMEVVSLGKYLPSGKDLFSMISTFSLVVLAWIFFRAPSIQFAINYIYHIFSNSSNTVSVVYPGSIVILLAVFLIVEWLGRGNQYAIEAWSSTLSKPTRWAAYYMLSLTIIYFYFDSIKQQFIYFQF